MPFIMKLRDFESYLFINPSKNLLKVYQSMAIAGKKVDVLFDDFNFSTQAKNIYFIKNNHYQLIEMKENSEHKDLDVKIYSKICRFKKGFFENIKRNQNDISIKDALLLKNGLTTYYITDFYRQTEDNHQNKNRLIITSMLKYSEGEKIKFLTLKKIMKCKIESEFYNTLEDSYYIFQENHSRIEMFFGDDHLFLIGNQVFEKQDAYEMIPTLRKFDFTVINESLFWINENNFLVKHKKNNIIVNEYSYLDLSVNMPEIWYEKLGRFLWEGRI